MIEKDKQIQLRTEFLNWLNHIENEYKMRQFEQFLRGRK